MFIISIGKSRIIPCVMNRRLNIIVDNIPKFNALAIFDNKQTKIQ